MDAGPNRRAIFFNSPTTTQRPNMISPVHAVTAPERIRVLPKLNSLTGIPKPIASRPANKQPIPTTNITIIIKLTPGPRPKCSQAARRHDTVILNTSPTSNCEGSSRPGPSGRSRYTIQDLILVQSFVPAAR